MKLELSSKMLVLDLAKEIEERMRKEHGIMIDEKVEIYKLDSPDSLIAVLNSITNNSSEFRELSLSSSLFTYWGYSGSTSHVDVLVRVFGEPFDCLQSNGGS